MRNVAPRINTRLTRRHPVIKEIRKEMNRRGWSAKTLSIEAGLSQSHVYAIIDGRATASLELADRLAKVFRRKLILGESTER